MCRPVLPGRVGSGVWVRNVGAPRQIVGIPTGEPLCRGAAVMCSLDGGSSMRKTQNGRRLVLAAGAVSAAAGLAQAQFSSNLEGPTYTGTPGGTLLTNGFGGPPGQDAWYNPVGGSLDHSVYTYAGNTPPWATAGAIPGNPSGGLQFGAGHNQNGLDFARAQHP